MGLFVFDEKDNRLDVSDSLDIIKCVALSGEQITTGMFVKYANGTRSSLGVVVMVAHSLDEAIGVVVDAPAFTIGSNERVFAVQRSGKCIVASEAGESFSSVTQYVSVGENGKAKSETLSFRGYRVLDTVDYNHAVIWFEDRTSGLGLFSNRFKYEIKPLVLQTQNGIPASSMISMERALYDVSYHPETGKDYSNYRNINQCILLNYDFWYAGNYNLRVAHSKLIETENSNHQPALIFQAFVQNNSTTNIPKTVLFRFDVHLLVDMIW